MVESPRLPAFFGVWELDVSSLAEKSRLYLRFLSASWNLNRIREAIGSSRGRVTSVDMTSKVGIIPAIVWVSVDWAKEITVSAPMGEVAVDLIGFQGT